MYMHDSEQLIAVNTETLSTSDIDAKHMLSIREPINGSHHKHEQSAQVHAIKLFIYTNYYLNYAWYPYYPCALHIIIIVMLL